MAPITNTIHHRQERKIPVSARKPVKKKAKDKPKRPLSAYNFFFKEERAKIVAVVLNEKGRDHDPELTDEEIVKLKKESGKVNFEEMGKLIGHRWRDVSEERKEVCDELAEHDKERYRIEMEKYNEKKEEMHKNKKYAETQYAQMAAAQGQQQRHRHPSMMPPPSMMRYPEMQASYGAGPPMGYAQPHPYPMEHQSAIQYSYRPHYSLMNMMAGAYNPYHLSSMPPPNYEGRHSPSNGTPHSNNQDTMNNSYHYQNELPHNSRYQYPPEYYRTDMVNTNSSNDQSYHPQQHGQKEPSSSTQNIEPGLNTSTIYHSQQQRQQSHNASYNHVNVF